MEPIIGTGQGQGAAEAANEVVKDTDQTRFEQDVLEASMQVPVIVDFWAPWCGPCKQLTPVLEKAVRDARGAVRLVKLNIDENRELATQLRIQSIPMVYAFYQGRPVDGFQGAQPESQITSFVDRLSNLGGGAPEDPVKQALEQAESALQQGEAGHASAIYNQVLQHDPENDEARAGLIACHLAANELDRAQSIYDALPEETKARPAYESVRARLELAKETAAAGDITELMERVAHDKDDHQSRFDLALALHAAGRREAAADELLEIVRRESKWNEEAARKQLVKFFEAWGHSDPLTVATRRKLSSLLFA